MRNNMRLVLACTGLLGFLFGDFSLTNKDVISRYLTFEAPYEGTHGAAGDYLGAGMLYYSIAYACKAKVCLCIGSGGGFVPRIMKQAQRDLGIQGARTLLVDANIGEFGRPLWLSPHSFFRTHYGDVELIFERSHETALRLQGSVLIDYLHIDGDHTEEGCWQDFIDYLPLMHPKGVITMHDTGDPSGGPYQVIYRIKELGYDVVDFKEFGAGVAIIRLGR